MTVAADESSTTRSAGAPQWPRERPSADAEATPRGPREPALHRHLPGLRGAIGWLPLGLAATPIEHAPALGRALGAQELWLKREDRSGLRHGGNKVRKLEWLLADALRRRSRAVLCLGAMGSNQVVATAFYARLLGLATYAVLVPQRMHDYARRNLRAALGLGCQIHVAASEAEAARHLVALTARLWAEQGSRPYLLWPGGSSPRGVLGAVELALEIATAVHAGAVPAPRYLFVPLASGGTLAGLALGLRLANLDTVPVGVRVYDRRFANETTVLGLARAGRRLLARTEPSLRALHLGRRDLRVLHDHAGAGYAEPTAEAGRAIELAREHAGLELEETYSGKALAGLGAFMSTPERRAAPAMFVCTYNSRTVEPFVAAAPPADSVAPELRRWLAR